LLWHFRTAVRALGAQRGFFASFAKDRASLKDCDLLLDCDPTWCLAHLDDNGLLNHPWLIYAMAHSEPRDVADIPAIQPAQSALVVALRGAGFGSAIVVPAHGGILRDRVSVMCLGYDLHCSTESDSGLVRVCARGLALELHDWWCSSARKRRLHDVHLSASDLRLLRHHLAGHGTKRIAASLNMTPGAVDSRFQRLNAKLRVPNRRMAGQLALDYGLVAPLGSSA